MSRAEIADYLGLTIETVSRAIGKLKNRNVIGLMGSDEVVVIDNDRLRQIGKVRRDAGSAGAATTDELTQVAGSPRFRPPGLRVIFESASLDRIAGQMRLLKSKSLLPFRSGT